MEQKDNLLGVLEIIFRRKREIFKICGIVFVGSVIISLLLPVYYKSTTTFYAASPDLANPDKLFGGGNSDTRYYGTGEDIDRLLTIAQSADVINYLVGKFDLYKHYNIDSTGAKALYKVRERLMDLYVVQKTKYDAIELSVEDKDKILAAQIANEARRRIEEISIKLIKESQQQTLNTCEQNIKESEAQLNALGDSLARLRERYSIYNPESQGETYASLLVGSESQVASFQGKLESYKSNPRTPRDTIIRVEANLKGAEQQLKKLKEDVKIFNQGMSIVHILTDQHEKARFQLSWDKERYKHLMTAKQGDFLVIHLVEEAQVPVVKSRPVRSLIVLAATVVAFILSILGVLILESYKDVNWRELYNSPSE